MTPQEWMDRLEGEGYTDLQTCKLPGDKDLGEHTHEQQTVHVILKGELILIEKGEEMPLRPVDHFEIPAGTTHSAKTGPHGCIMIVGVKR